LAVIFDAGRIGAENEAVLLIEIAVNEDRKTVSILKVSISATVGDNDARWVCVITNDADI